jgi:hypothetical protein
MKTLRDHPFFKTVEEASRIEKLVKAWGSGRASRQQFFMSLKKAHPFIFDKRVTFEKRMDGRATADFENLVEDFSLPFKDTLYLMTDSPSILAPQSPDNLNDKALFTLMGYLIHEIDPEHFMVFEVANAEVDGQTVPYINQFQVDLKSIQTMTRMMKAIREDGEENRGPNAHFLKETNVILQFTDCISVKRIGIETVKTFNLKNRGTGTGITSVKMDNLIHIADKVQYKYTSSAEDSEINWDYVGFWRGHWRAFYVKDAKGDNVKDDRGWNVVDYGRSGKDRIGNPHCVPGYAWVVDHMKGHPALAQIKTHFVKKG